MARAAGGACSSTPSRSSPRPAARAIRSSRTCCGWPGELDEPQVPGEADEGAAPLVARVGDVEAAAHLPGQDEDDDARVAAGLAGSAAEPVQLRLVAVHPVGGQELRGAEVA